VEESLKAAAARVPYDGSHRQWETTILGGREYKDMKGMNYIALVHIVYHAAPNSTSTSRYSLGTIQGSSTNKQSRKL
jgi:hypothetical protein